MHWLLKHNKCFLLKRPGDLRSRASFFCFTTPLYLTPTGYLSSITCLFGRYKITLALVFFEHHQNALIGVRLLAWITGSSINSLTLEFQSRLEHLEFLVGDESMGNLIIWSGWIGGIGIGLYLLLQFWITNKPLGCSTSYGNVAGMVVRSHYFQSGEFESLNNWRLWFMLGLPIGGALAALTSPNYVWDFHFSMGQMYDSIMPAELWKKAIILLSGGVFMGVGARLAGGCTSGHAISGISMLNYPSMLAGGLFFAGGIGSVQFIFKLLN